MGTIGAGLFASCVLFNMSTTVKADDVDHQPAITVDKTNDPNSIVTSNGYGDAAFLNYLGLSAQKLANNNGLYASVMVAQALLESGWGTSSLAQAPNYNLFGIKGSYQGSAVNFSTQEDNGSGSLYTIKSNFRKYPSYKESLEDYVRLIRSNGRTYSGVWRHNADSYKVATQFLTGRYATDTTYNQKLNSIIERFNLTRFDQAPSDVDPVVVNVQANDQTKAQPALYKVEAKNSKSQDAYQNLQAPIIVQNDFSRHDSATADPDTKVTTSPVVDETTAKLVHEDEQYQKTISASVNNSDRKGEDANSSAKQQVANPQPTPQPQQPVVKPTPDKPQTQQPTEPQQNGQSVNKPSGQDNSNSSKVETKPQAEAENKPVTEDGPLQPQTELESISPLYKVTDSLNSSSATGKKAAVNSLYKISGN
ncbi:glycoside hydrolase family 73 protein [Lactobacillus sp. DCY120]|uniref:Glycoside hydrolase family 73 protein n=1 Tax=Bombilactobacillus apium TaxID=2675299 RepID=A0A850R187_9LACO|nr:glycoside hydrolase family 73 protein [Bombilactobacillus apium]NVY96859.1 glycoside hydrolase family 73 protein [Bombilactobacillus apium]